MGHVYVYLIAGILLFSTLAVAQPIATNRNAEASTQICDCVIVRLDDIQGDWLIDAQQEVMDALITAEVPTTIGLIMDPYGNDQDVVDKVDEGVSAELFELAIHSWNHTTPFSSMTLQRQTDDLEDSQIKFESIYDYETDIFITPFNAYNSDTKTAMLANNMTILSSAWQPGYPVLPDTDESGIYHVNQDSNYGYDSGDDVHAWRTIAEMDSMLDNAVTTRGFATLTIHPQDFVVWTSGNTVYTDTLNQTRIDTFMDMIDEIREDHTIMSMHDAIDTAIALDTDLTKPVVTISAPTAGYDATKGVGFTVSGTASDNRGMSIVEVRATNSAGSAGTSYQAVSTSDDYATWTTTLVIPNTSYTKVWARATDDTGNQQWASVIIDVLDDTTLPTGSITSPAANDPFYTNQLITVTGTASDNASVTSAEVRAVNDAGTDGTTYAPATTSNGYATWSYSSLDISNHPEWDNIEVRITDFSGNQRWYEIPITTTYVDETPPTGSITSPAAMSTQHVNVAFTVSGTADDVAVSNVEVRLINSGDTDGTAYQSASTSDGWDTWSTSISTSNQSYNTIKVRITDSNGNQNWYTRALDMQS